jgi:hypothetical protein
MELEGDHQLPFLDVLVNRRSVNWLGYAVYRKATNTDIQAVSHHPPAHKRFIITALMDRANSVTRLA